MRPRPHPRIRLRRRPAARGIVLLYTLIALVILLIGAMALMRSFNDSLYAAGNLSFKRDLQNRAERASVAVLAEFAAGGRLATEVQRATSRVDLNYSAVQLASNAQGIPEALLDTGTATTRYTPVATLTAGDDGGRVRYVVDRLCASVGSSTALGTGQCVWASATAVSGGLQNLGHVPLPPPELVYRLSVRVDGPRGTQAFFQTTFTAPTT